MAQTPFQNEADGEKGIKDMHHFQLMFLTVVVFKIKAVICYFSWSLKVVHLVEAVDRSGYITIITWT